MSKNSNNSGREYSKLAIGMCVGVAAGTAIGSATHNIGLWLPLGVAFGVAFGLGMSRIQKDNGEDFEQKAAKRRPANRSQLSVEICSVIPGKMPN